MRRASILAPARAPVLALAIVGLVLAGCVQSPKDLSAASTSAGARGPWPADGAFVLDGKFSKTLVNGTLATLPVQVVDVKSFDGTLLNVGIFRPDTKEKVPVLVDIGPYYNDGDDAVNAPAHRLGMMLIDNFVPHGYAVVQASIRGTGGSTGCGDYMGPDEQKDIDSLVTWLGTQEWSSGSVGVIGKSYDGSTPWEAATTGNKHLKTIVPIEGIDSLQQLHFRNGSAESRSLILGSLYYSYALTSDARPGPGAQPDARFASAKCVQGAQATPMGALGYATGGGTMLDYWKVRDFRARTLANYHGSIFYVHGLQDWNVKPSQGTDIYNQFNGTKKVLMGQWAHNYPDRPGENPSLRMDFAEMLLRWFDHELKGLPVDTGPAVTVEDDHGNWRDEPSNAWPPLDAKPMVLHPGADGKLVANGSKAGDITITDPAPATLLATPLPFATPAVWEGEPFAREARISGSPTFHVTVTPSQPGGNLWAELHEILANGSDFWIGRAQMDLRYAAGGDQMQSVTPGAPILAKMEFYPLDARILAGAHLRLILREEANGVDPLPNPMSGRVDIATGDGKTTLTLPIIERPFVKSRWDVDLPPVK